MLTMGYCEIHMMIIL